MTNVPPPFKIPVTPYKDTTKLFKGNAVLKLKNSDFKNVTFKEGTLTLVFFDCRLMDLEILNEEEINFEHISIGFYDCFIGSLSIKQITSKNISVSFHHSIVSGKVESTELSSFDLSSCLTVNSLFLMDMPNISIRYHKNINDDHWREVIKKLNVGLVLNDELPVPKYFIYNPGSFTLSTDFVGPMETRFTPEISLKYEKDNDIKSRISRALLRSLSISGKPKGELTIENTKIDRWYIYNFQPQDTVSFHDIQPLHKGEMKIGIHKANLDEVEFDNISFDLYPIISFYRSKFSKAIFTSCDFPETFDSFSSFLTLENVHYPDDKMRNFEKAQYEMFLQLKNALDETGNYYESQKLQAIAHEALRRIKTLSWWDRQILAINQESNEHGLSIKRPFLWYLFFSIGFYILYLSSLGLIFKCSPIDWRLVGYYFPFTDITHRNDFLVDKDKLTGWSVFFDYAGKLMVGFFIYQFVVAFRKYGKTK